MLDIIHKNKKIILGFFIILIMSLIVLTTYYCNNSSKVLAKVEEKVEKTKEKSNNAKVDIKGAIANPGVYELTDNSRVIDAINMAGGVIEGANTSLINLSKKITDQMVIVIYTNEEIENYNASKIKTEYVYIEVENCPDKINQACVNEYSNETSENTSNSKININTASIEELTTLSGIGNSKAQAIIDYRNQNGNFKDIVDLNNVTGIGNSIIEKIKDNITV